ncbi:MAG: hypothetical protein HY343_00845 [Lentisphaerae bacterium]|nr:hypothetical protein [Lentisphaerota bacterium]
MTPGKPITIRRLRPEDAGALCAFYNGRRAYPDVQAGGTETTVETAGDYT